ncbi:ExbD/TolR family protein [Elusimicrobiota bacterium]
MGMQSQSDGPIIGINVTPLVDVCLVLVIIFMVTAPLLEQSSLSIKLPKATTQEGEEKSNITITITQDNRWAINSNEYPKEEIADILSVEIRKVPDRLVIIRSDRDSYHKELMEAMKIAKASGALSITIATEQR